jgi:hypothetical protein
METKPLTKLVIGGKEYPCRITFGAMVRYKQQTGEDISQVQQGDIASMALFVWCCVKSASNADGVPFEMSFEDFIDRLEPDAVNSFYGSLENSQKKTGAKK